MNSIAQVNERWKMRNGEIAIIEFRNHEASVCSGHLEGSRIPFCWSKGKTGSGNGYDLVECLSTALTEDSMDI